MNNGAAVRCAGHIFVRGIPRAQLATNVRSSLSYAKGRALGRANNSMIMSSWHVAHVLSQVRLRLLSISCWIMKFYGREYICVGIACENDWGARSRMSCEKSHR